MPGDVDFRRIPAILGNMFEHPCHGLGSILRIGWIMGTRAKPVVDGCHGIALAKELLGDMLLPAFQTTAMEPHQSGKTGLVFRIIQVQFTTLRFIGILLTGM